jgi:hypothetical protein
MRPYQEQTERFFAPIRAEHEEALGRGTQSLRSGQAARGIFTAGGGAAQEGEMQRRAALNLAAMRSGTEQQQQARQDALLQYIHSAEDPYEMMGVQLPMQELGFQTGQIAQRYGQPRGMGQLGGALQGAGGSLAQMAMLQALYGGGFGDGGTRTTRTPLENEYAWGPGQGGGGYQAPNFTRGYTPFIYQ